MKPLASLLPLTHIRIFGASILYRLLRPFVGKKQVQVTRGGIRLAHSRQNRYRFGCRAGLILKHKGHEEILCVLCMIFYVVSAVV